jgi:hypothetical protein
MPIGNIHSLIDKLPRRSHNYNPVLFDIIGQSLTVFLSYLRNIGRPWWELGDYLLVDIGKTTDDAEVEKLRHRVVIRDPHELSRPSGSVPRDSCRILREFNPDDLLDSREIRQRIDPELRPARPA